MADAFHKFASKSAEVVGSAKSFFAALLLIVVWTMAGPSFGWSDGHQLFINTVMTVVTFLMVFLIQHTSLSEPVRSQSCRSEQPAPLADRLWMRVR